MGICLCIYILRTHTPLKEYTGNQHYWLPLGRKTGWLRKTANPYVPHHLMYDGSKQVPNTYIYSTQVHNQLILWMGILSKVK